MGNILIQLVQTNSAQTDTLALHPFSTFLIDTNFTNASTQLPGWSILMFFLFFTGLLGMIYNYKSFLITMMSVEVMYLGNVASFVLYGVAARDSNSSIYALLILIFAACESAIGLGLLIVLYRFGHSVAFDTHSTLNRCVLVLLTISPVLSQYEQTYFGISLYLVLAVLLCALLATIAYLLSLSTSQDTEKRSEYECGFAPFDSATRLPFDVHFYLVGILFLIFDVEVALLFPWTLSLSTMSWFGFYLMVGFIVVLTIGFIYEWKRGALIWPSRQRTPKLPPTNAPTAPSYKAYPWFVIIISSYENLLEFVTDSTNYTLHLFTALLPEVTLFVIVSTLITLAALLFNGSFTARQLTQQLFASMCFGVAYTALEYFTRVINDEQPRLILDGYLFTSYFVVTMKLLVLVCGLFVLYTACEYVVNHKRALLEFPVVLVLALIFMLTLVGANHLIAAFLALAGFSLNMYVLILFDAPNHVSREAGIKYYYLSTLSTGFILYGTFLLYVLSGSGQFGEMEQAMTLYGTGEQPMMLAFGVSLMLVGFMFKLSAFPGHLWAPDVYEGSPAAVTAFFMLPVKISVLAFFMRFTTTATTQISSLWLPGLSLACIGSIIWGAFAAINSRSARRFLAFTSINQMGFLLIGLVCNSVAGYRSTIIYLFIYAVMSMAFLLVFIHARREDGRHLRYLTDFRGFGQASWLQAWTVVIVLFSMAGIPPLAGFFGKYYLLIHAMEESLYVIVVTALVTSLVSTYYYLRIVKIMWFEGAETMTRVSCPLPVTSSLIFFSAELTLWAFMFFAPDVVKTANGLSESLFRLVVL